MSRKFKSIKNRIIVFFIGVAVFQMLAVGFFALFHLKPSIHKMYTEHLDKFAQSGFWEVTSTKQKIETYMVNMIGDESIQQFLETTSAGSEKEISPVISAELRNRILSYTDYDSAIRAIYLIDNEGRVYSNQPEKRIKEYLQVKAELTGRSDASAVWYSDYDQENLIVYRIVNNNKTNLTRKIGAICMVINQDIYADLLNQFLLEDNQNYILASRDGRMKISSMPSEVAITANKYITCRQENENWYLYTWIDKKTAYAPVNLIFKILALELLLLLGVTSLLVVYLSGRITRPISDIRDAMHQMGKGNIGIQIPISEEDEVGQLAGTMNRMSERIEELVEEIHQDETRQRLLELKAMQYQINPHFLYNALDSISMYARKNNDERCEKLVLALSTFFRISLSHGQEYVTLKEELRYVECYLEIQDIRFPRQLTWDIQVPEEIRMTKVIKFILQPLVENSIYHGIRDAGRHGHIEVKARREREDLILSVSDDGMGMLPEELAALQEKIERQEDIEKEFREGGFGMRNVHQRLKLIYGESAGLQMESEWEEGTCITIRIPGIYPEQ